MIAAAYYGDQFQIVLAGACTFPAHVLRRRGSPNFTGAVDSMALTVFGIAWIGIPFAHAVLLRELPLHGGALLVDVVVATFVADTAAYAGGRLFGRHQLAPSLSPNKTVEGLAFGFVGGTMGFWFAGLYQDWLPGLDALLMGMCIAAVAPIGDLFESMVKRDLGSRTPATSSAPTAGCSTASTRSCSRSSPATTWRSRSSTDAGSAARTNSRSARSCLRGPGVSTTTGAPAVAADSDHRRQRLGADLAGAEVGVAVGAGAGRVAGVVGVQEVDAAGDRQHALDGVASSSPAAWAWQVSKQKPTGTGPS